MPDVRTSLRGLASAVLGATGGIGTALRRRLGARGARARRRSVTGVVPCVGSLVHESAHRTSPAAGNAVLATNLTSAFAVLHVDGGLGRVRPLPRS